MSKGNSDTATASATASSTATTGSATSSSATTGSATSSTAATDDTSNSAAGASTAIPRNATTGTTTSSVVIMERYVKNITRYLTEALNKSEWLNYKTETALNTPNPDGDISRVATFMQKLLNVDDPSTLLFTGDDVSIGEDYKYFVDSIIPKSEEKKSGTYPAADYTAFYTLYSSRDRFFVKFDVRDMREFSYIFIRESDYEYFDGLDAPIVPGISATAAQPTPAQSVPAQPGGGGSGAPLV